MKATHPPPPARIAARPPPAPQVQLIETRSCDCCQVPYPPPPQALRTALGTTRPGSVSKQRM